MAKTVHPSNAARILDQLSRAKSGLIEALRIAEGDTHGTVVANRIDKIAGLIETLQHDKRLAA